MKMIANEATDKGLTSKIHKQFIQLLKYQKNKPTNQKEKIGSPEINPCTYGNLIFDKGGKNIQWIKDNLFNKWCWEN